MKVKNLKDYNGKDCKGLCDRKPLMTREGLVLICEGCKRIVMDNRK